VIKQEGSREGCSGKQHEIKIKKEEEDGANVWAHSAVDVTAKTIKEVRTWTNVQTRTEEADNYHPGALAKIGELNMYEFVGASFQSGGRMVQWSVGVGFETDV